MSFELPEEGGEASRSRSKINLSGAQIATAVVGAIIVVASVVWMFIVGPELGHSSNIPGGSFTDTFPDYGRLLLLLIGFILIARGLFRKTRD